MKQTAVEWLIEKVNGQSTGLGMYGMNVRIDIPSDIIQQAKEMERQHIIDTYKDGNYDNGMGRCEPELYYDETYNSKKK